MKRKEKSKEKIESQTTAGFSFLPTSAPQCLEAVEARGRCLCGVSQPIHSRRRGGELIAISQQAISFSWQLSVVGACHIWGVCCVLYWVQSILPELFYDFA